MSGHLPRNASYGQYGSGGARPEGAIPVEEGEILAYQLTLINDWVPSSEMWALKEGSNILGGLAGLSGLVFNTYYRNRFLLYQHARYASTFSSFLLPAIITSTWHSVFIKSEILVNQSSCPLCLELRSSAAGAGWGTLYPLVLTWIQCMGISKIKYTMHLPPRNDGKAWLKFFKGQNSKIKLPFLILLGINTIAGTWIVKEEQKATVKLIKRMEESS